MGTRFRRRTLLQGTAAMAGSVPVLGSAIGISPVRAAGLERGSSPTIVSWAPWGGWPSYGGSKWQAFMQPGIDHFEGMNPGIKVQLVSPGGGGSFLPQILAGTAPDIIQDWAIGPYLNANAVLNLSPYLRQDNLSTSLWSPGQMYAMTNDQGVWFLPCYVHTTVMAVNYSLIDQLGLKRPSQDWTMDDAAQLYRSATGTRNGQHAYGAGMYFTGSDMGDPSSMSEYVFHFYGGRMVAPNHLQCEIGDPKAYKGVEWVEQLHYENVLSPSARTNDLAHIPFCEIGSNEMVTVLESWRDQFEWSFFPLPRFPNGQFGFEATDYHAISASTKHPDASWALLKFLAADPYWSRYSLKYLLRTPSLLSVWPEYARTIETVAPVARGRNVELYVEAASKWGIANGIFQYQQPQVASIINTYLGKAYNRQGTVAALLPEAARQVDALEASGAVIAAGNSRIDVLLAGAKQSSGAVTFPAPPAFGAGTAAKPAAKGALTVSNGTYAVEGTGSNPLRGTDDGLTFACMPWTKSQGTFTCRLVSVASVGPATIPDNCKIGLMARGALSSDAADAAVVVAMGRSVQFPSRPFSGTDVADQGTYNTSGMLGQAGVLGKLSTKLDNYMLKPVWLRLVQNVNMWTAYASLDGKTWTQQGKTIGIEAAGVWVGLCVSPALPESQHVKATFDSVSFVPTQAYQIG